MDIDINKEITTERNTSFEDTHTHAVMHKIIDLGILQIQICLFILYINNRPTFSSIHLYRCRYITQNNTGYYLYYFRNIYYRREAPAATINYPTNCYMIMREEDLDA